MTEKLSFGQIVKITVTLIVTAVALCGVLLGYAYVQNTADSSASQYSSVFVTVLLLLFALYIYLFFVKRENLIKIKNIVALDVIIVVGVALCLFIGESLSVYFRPYAFVALMITLLIGKRTAAISVFVSSMVVVVADAYFTAGSGLLLADLILGIASSLLYLFLISRDKRRFSTIMTALKMCGVTAVGAALVEMYSGFTIQVLYAAIWGAGSSLLTVGLFMGVLPIFEYAFNFVTDYRLFELTDHNNKMLLDLAQNAPGTFNHSIVAANLAEACALAIGENTNLARAAAYYHDIGKLKNAIYFKENQIGASNPHDDITPEVSVEIIKNHVSNGVAMAKANRLPNEIVDVIKEHHGTLPIKVFYYKALKYTDGDLGISAFSYDGPKPKSRISAIMMIADACEAAVRVLEKRTPENVEKVVSDVIEERMALNQFTDCDITFADIYTIKDVIIKTLSGVYHERVKYPDMKLYADKNTDEKIASGEENK